MIGKEKKSNSENENIDQFSSKCAMLMYSKTANKLIRTHTIKIMKKKTFHNEMQKRANLPAIGADITETRSSLLH